MGKLYLKKNDPIMECPYCHMKMYRSKLRAHVDSEHPYRRTTDEVQKDESITSIDLSNKVIEFLNLRNFTTQHIGNFIIARNSFNDKTLCVRIARKNEYNRFSNTPILSTFKRFQKIVSQMNKRRNTAIDFGGFNSEVITPFGWHADRNETVRHDALLDASIVWGVSHIASVLQWMRNAWPNNPLLDKYSDVVIADHRWFSNNLGSRKGDISTFQLKRVLSNELSKYGPQIKLLSSVYEIDRWFVLKQ